MNANASVTFSLTATSFSPNSGSAGGGNILRITGSGFSNDTKVDIDGYECLVSGTTYNTLDCIVPSNVSYFIFIVRHNFKN